jgi:hypothetical protein
VSIEQAIFTSGQTHRSEGYHLVATSGGIASEEAHELSSWCPSHDAMSPAVPGDESVNFHALASGRYCVALTTATAGEYSQRGGARLYTQCLLLAPEDLLRFGNNPFAVLRAARAGGLLTISDPLSERLPCLELGGTAAAVNQALLARLALDPGALPLTAIIEELLARPTVGLLGARQPRKMLEGLLSCLPVECRPAFSLTTGLRFSPRRSFRCICLGDDLNEVRRLQKQRNLTVIDLQAESLRKSTVTRTWSQFLRQMFLAGKLAFLAEQLAVPRPELTLAGLDDLGEQLLRNLQGEVDTHRRTEIVRRSGSFNPVNLAQAVPATPPSIDTRDNEQWLRERAQRARRAEPSKVEGALALKDQLLPDAPLARDAQLGRLQQLEDLIFEAIAGKRSALGDVAALWQGSSDWLGPELRDQSREHYVRKALDCWGHCIEGDSIRTPERAIAAIEVVRVLLGE